MKDTNAKDCAGARAAARHSMHAGKQLPGRATADALTEKRARWKSKPGVFVVESSGTLLDHGRKPSILVQGKKSPRVIIETPRGTEDSVKQTGKTTIGRHTVSVAMSSRMPEDFRAMRQSRLASVFM
ncbi:MAG: hypothetical protein OXP12_02255 [Thaumarchaeota archaeon]|nr:hypothetical protein [Nitrososphaerota archaeon]MDE0267245.1 hypothetical protein [Nitrososphaerota archaeon]MDE0527001.1 hypothetical protein [Nitrososphaerota archaeon]